MICNQLTDCLRSIHNTEIKEVRLKAKDEKKQKDRKVKNQKSIFPYCDYPCNDESRCQKCVVFVDKRRAIVCEEHDAKYILQMDGEIESVCFHVDGGIIDKEEPIMRCDYAVFLRDSDKQFILIELKGMDCNHALDQLSAMLDLEMIKKTTESGAVGRLYGRIVCTRRVPAIYERKENVLQRRFVRCGGNLKIMSRIGEEAYQDLQTL